MWTRQDSATHKFSDENFVSPQLAIFALASPNKNKTVLFSSVEGKEICLLEFYTHYVRVDPTGLEPATSSVQMRCSTKMSYGPASLKPLLIILVLLFISKYSISVIKVLY